MSIKKTKCSDDFVHGMAFTGILILVVTGIAYFLSIMP